ncbi:O domain protein, partial [Escherichia coli 96.0427]
MRIGDSVHWFIPPIGFTQNGKQHFKLSLGQICA